MRYPDNEINLLPAYLFNTLNTDPETFIYFVKLYYGSSIDEQNYKTEKILYDNKNNVLHNIYFLFQMWNTLPGIGEDDVFNFNDFKNWYDKVLELAYESGHTEIVKHLIGKKLINVPESPEVFWIDKNIACYVYSKKQYVSPLQKSRIFLILLFFIELF
ncbi:MAG: hypothetical protein LBM93_09065 [Oscillospiraceae bacterium]|jgi:hypothetical protein|nr:hypothetical protein [Oscillospiraceae bacterium]